MTQFRRVHASRRLYMQGFTLIELMITVAIIAILARIALPAYTSYVARSKLTEASTNLSDLRVKMEQYYQDNRKYTDSSGNCGVSAPATQNAPYFAYTCSATASTYTWTAAGNPNIGLGASGDYTYTINETNSKATTKFKGVTQSGKTCWLMKGTEC